MTGGYVAPTPRVTDYALVDSYARVDGDARVDGLARVTGNGWVTGRGDIRAPRHILTVGPVGSEDRTVTVHRHYDGPDSTVWGALVVAGCWTGTLDALAERIQPGGAHGWLPEDAAECRADYQAVITIGRVRAAEWAAQPLTAADHAWWAARLTEIEATQ